MSTVVFELGEGDRYVLCLQRFQKNLGPFINYRWSKFYQVHQITIGVFVLSWRIGPYKAEHR